MVPGPTVTIRISSALRAWAGVDSEVVVSAASVRAALAEIAVRQPSLYRGICDETGAIRRHVNLFVNTDHIRDREGLDTALATGDELTVFPAVSGG
jgi:molybdopterin synthase sulfur carrier subunit